MTRLLTLQFEQVRVRVNYAKGRDEQFVVQRRYLHNEVAFGFNQMTPLVKNYSGLWQVFSLSLIYNSAEERSATR